MCRALAIHSIPIASTELVYAYMHAFRHDAHRDDRIDNEVIGGGSGRVVGGAAPGVITNGHEVDPALCTIVGMHRSLGGFIHLRVTSEGVWRCNSYTR